MSIASIHYWLHQAAVDFVSAVDIHWWLQVPRPDGKPDQLGMTSVDEPCPRQTDPSILKLSLRMHNKFSNKSADEVCFWDTYGA